MKYFEYVWLASAIFLFVFMIVEHSNLRTFNFVALLAGIAISSFMFSYRRRARMKLEKLREAEMREIEKELDETS